MYDVIIIGAGPAGISAGIYAKRANLNVLILYHGISNLEKATMIENYYGFENGISGEDLYKAGIKQAQNLGIEVKNEEVLNIEKNDEKFEITTTENKYIGNTSILATGNKKLKPNIKGIEEYDGKGISYCAICDGFFYRKKNVVVIGNGKYAISEAEDLKNIVNNVTILTNGLDLASETSFEVNTKKIKEIKGDTKVRQIVFEDGTNIDVDGIFVALGEAGGSDFAKKLGVLTKNDNIIVDENMKTNIDGMYSCGNSTGGLLQVAKAVHEGAEAGLAIVNFLKNK